MKLDELIVEYREIYIVGINKKLHMCLYLNFIICLQSAKFGTLVDIIRSRAVNPPCCYCSRKVVYFRKSAVQLRFLVI